MKKVIISLILLLTLSVACVGLASCGDTAITTGAPTTTIDTTTTAPLTTTEEPPTTTVAPHAHEFGAWTVTKAATCIAKGELARICACGEKETAELDVTGHTEAIDKAVKATCVNTGLTEGKHCAVCNVTLVAQQETPVVAHTYTDKYDETCNACGHIRDVECAHLETLVILGYEATCAATGLTDGTKCKKCGEILTSQSVIPLKPHTEVIDEAVEASCSNFGLTEGKHCSVCEAVLVWQSTIPKKPHTEVIDKAVEATCANTGLTEGKHCSVCDVILVARSIIPAKAHTWGGARNYDNDGHWLVCSVCPAVEKFPHTVDEVGFCVSCDYQVPSEGLTFTNILSGYAVSGIGTCTDTDIVIPKQHNGYFVTQIEPYAFKDCTSLTSITIPDSVGYIGGSAFSGCSNLTSITIPDSVGYIGGSAFSGCSNLTSITIPDSVTSIGTRAFEGCESLTNITIPDSVTTIGDYMFKGCRSLTNITIPDGVTSIDRYAFCECTNLTSITIPDSVTTIGIAAFQDCTSLTNITIPDSVTSIGNYSFYGCSSLRSVTIGKGVTNISGWAFQGCSSLESIIISDSVTIISGNAFRDCSGLTSIIIPDSVTTIGNYAFEGCNNLTIYCEAESEPDGWNTVFTKDWNSSNRPVVWNYKG